MGFSIPGNEIGSNVLYWRDQKGLQGRDLQFLNYFYELKTNYTTIFKQSVSILVSGRHLDNPIILRARELIGLYTEGLEQCLQKCPVHGVTNVNLLLHLEEIMKFLTSCTRNGQFYSEIASAHEGLQNTVMEIVGFSDRDYKRFYHEPEEFVNELAHTLQNEEDVLFASFKTKQERLAQGDDEQEVENYASLKSVAGELMKNMCRYVDGALTELVNLCLNVLQGKINSKHSGIRMTLMLSAIRS